MSAWLKSIRVGRATVASDAVTGFVMAMITIPGDLANGVLAGVNPVYALYSLMVGTAVAGLFTSTMLMNVDSTSATSLTTFDIVSGFPSDQTVDVLVVLALLAGIFMLAFGILKLGYLVRFISNAVMTGFLSGVAVLTIIGQFGDLTGYYSDAGNKVTRAIDTLVHPGLWDWPTFIVGATTIAIIMVLDRTRLSRYSFLIGIVIATLLSSSVFAGEVTTVGDTTTIPRSLPTLHMPDLSLIPALLLPALSLAILALVQAAGVSQGYPNPDGSDTDASADFRGQGMANVAVGLCGGITVGGSLGNTALLVSCGARSRWANIFTALFAAIGVLLLASVIELLPMSGLAGLLVVVGITMLNPQRIKLTWHTGVVPAVVMSVVFVATLFVPIQYAIFLGVIMTFVVHVYGSAEKTRVEALAFDPSGSLEEVEVPHVLADHQVVILEPVGSLFFAGASAFELALPDVTKSNGAAVVVRLREFDDVGSTLVRALGKYARDLQAAEGRLYLAGVEKHAHVQLERTGLLELIGADAVFDVTPRRGDSLRRAARAAQEWVDRFVVAEECVSIGETGAPILVDAEPESRTPPAHTT